MAIIDFMAAICVYAQQYTLNDDYGSCRGGLEKEQMLRCTSYQISRLLEQYTKYGHKGITNDFVLDNLMDEYQDVESWKITLGLFVDMFGGLK